MSDSRLEKFIYAICSMDVTDLPVPLSRIEKLWNCLITGEIPDFEPLSRNEKYLMAMLDRYDISNLPAPMSRGEKLLYKIAVGETDLSDVPGYLSRYEELLKYLIENGGIGNFEYVLHTLNQSLSTLYSTAEKPVKSAILTGNTLVNLINVKNATGGIVYTTKDLNLAYELPVGKYILFYDVIKANTSSGLGKPDRHTPFITFNDDTKIYQGFEGFNTSNGKKYWIINATKPIVKVEYWLANLVEDGEVDNLRLFAYQDGMENWDIPYFEGMQSVKMPVLTTTGKNLFHSDIQVFNLDNYIRTGNDINTVCDTELKPSTTYTLSWNGNNRDGKISLYSNGIKTNSINIGWYKSGITFTTSEVEDGFSFYTKLSDDSSLTSDMSFNVQLEEGTTATPFEPYKSNILTVNEPIELRRVGNVQDTLDLMTGELVQRIGEIKITDEMIDKFTIYKNFITNFNSIFNGLPERKIETFTKNSISMVSDKMVAKAWTDATMAENIVYFSQYSDGEVRVTHSPDWTLDEFKEWFRENKPTIQYELATPVVKTVVLTVVNQDNQPAKLGTFENITHVSLESAGLIPEVAMEVATHISKELASASPLMDDISTKQEQLNTTVDEQSNNVDATMIATTEIYEETL